MPGGNTAMNAVARDENALLRLIRPALDGRYPLIGVITPEERRALDAFGAAAAEAGVAVRAWTCVDGWSDAPADGATRDPVAAIRALRDAPRAGFHVMKDISPFLARAEVVRALRDAKAALAPLKSAHLILLAPELDVPAALAKDVFLLELPLPAPDELAATIERVRREYPGAALSDRLRSVLALALRGLTLDEASHVMHAVFAAGAADEAAALDRVFAAKQSLLRREGFLHFIPRSLSMDSVGGLEVLREWALKRKDLFTQASFDAGLPVPRGVLIMGVSGCGKSLSAKAIASLWRVPLFRLDMNLVFSGLYGTPEAAFNRALETVEALAPVVLWIDEVENALGMTTKTATVEQSLTFSSFLTWMQERPPLVFIAATANRIESLPAEVLRKGRFDEVFFCDLPGPDERREIFKIHLRLNGADPEKMDVDRLLHSTEGWTGAEIEQAVISARIDAHTQGRAMTLEDVRRYTVRMIPLSTTMSEQIAAIRDWAYNRAQRASRAAPRPLKPER